MAAQRVFGPPRAGVARRGAESQNVNPHKQPLPMQIAYPYKSVTPDGYTHDPVHDACDVETMDCVEPVDEWVDECGVCGGSGYVKSYTSKYLATCLQCHGMGYVRVATQRLQPNGTSLYGQNKLIRGPNRSGEGAAP